jgi:hypothetical protein
MPKLIDSIDMGEQLFDIVATPTTVQERALELLQLYNSLRRKEGSLK